MQINALNYMRLTVITDKHVKSHFVLTVTESVSQHSYNPLVFHTLPHILHSEAREGTDNTLDKMKFKSYLLKLVSLNRKKKTQKLHIKRGKR